MRAETIADKEPGFPVRPQPGLGIKYKPQPIEANLGIRVTGLRACKVPPRSWVRRPRASESGRWPDD
jgi:hypothetical protein